MVDIEQTLYNSVVHHINMLRYQAKDNPKAFRSLIESIIINDILSWTENEGEYDEVTLESIRQHLVNLNTQRLLCNSAFKLTMTNDTNAYVNVNTEQRNTDWQQLWDNPSVQSCKVVPLPHTTDKTLIPVKFVIKALN